MEFNREYSEDETLIAKKQFLRNVQQFKPSKKWKLNIFILPQQEWSRLKKKTSDTGKNVEKGAIIHC